MKILKLRRLGNSFGFIVERPILELLGMAQGDEFELKTDGENLVLRKVRK